MLRQRNTHRRAGFTLIEILVTVTIVAVVMSLLLAGVMKAIGVGPKADTSARIANVNNAIGTFKSNASFGQVNYIPAGRLEGGQWLPFRLRNQYATPATANDPGPNSFEYMYLQQVFGGGRGLNINDLGYRDNSGNANLSADLDANQTLTFFLGGIPEVSGNAVMFTGFSSNPQQPFTRSNPAASGEVRRGPLLDLGGTKPKYLLAPNGFPWMIDGFNNPFAYFTSYDGKPARSGFPYGGFGNGNLQSTKPGGPMGNVIPYSRSNQFENPSGFQLISAGKDGVFGTTGDWTSVTGTAGEDDQASFTDRLLGAGPR